MNEQSKRLFSYLWDQLVITGDDSYGVALNILVDIWLDRDWRTLNNLV